MFKKTAIELSSIPSDMMEQAVIPLYHQKKGVEARLTWMELEQMEGGTCIRWI